MLTRYKFLTAVCAFAFALLLAFNLYLSLPYYQMQSAVMLNQLSSNQSLNVHARSYLAKGGDESFLLAGDVGSDKAQLSLLCRELIRRGYGVLIFDMPSEGMTDGAIPFGYKGDSEFLAHYFYNTYVAYTQLANISVDKLHVVGFGESARAILQTGTLGLLRSQAANSSASPIDLTLVGTDINLTDRMDFDILNYREDESVEWIKKISRDNPGIPVHLICSSWDRVSTYADNEKLQELLSEPSGVEIEGSEQQAGAQATLAKLSGLPHGSLMRSAKVAESIIQATVDSSYKAPPALYLRTPAIYASLALFCLLCYFAGKLMYRQLYTAPLPERKRAPGIIQAKLFMNLFGLIVDALIVLALYAAPIPFPYYSVFYIAAIAGFGAVMLVLYRFTDFANNLGSSVIIKDTNANFASFILSLASIVACVSAMMASFPDAIGAFWAKPMWAAILIALFMPILYVDEKERRLFADEGRLCFLLFISNFLMLWLSPLLCAAVGLFDAAFTAFEVIAATLAALCTEFICRPLGLSSFSTAFAKAIVLTLLAFSDMALFY
ncbi:MAG: hypothetical protein LBC69_03430 [Eubacteriaceae bacterium]|jgi:hypothetical protein|nr:hypothetical protein [Eubacteriaceae bacterium]